MNELVEVSAVAAADKDVLGNLLQLYLHDFSELRQLEVTPQGVFAYPYLDHYFSDIGREACFIKVDDSLAGFSMTRRLEDGSREMSEFFVLRRHRCRGAGRVAALKVLRRHPGSWRLSFDHANRAACRFWPGLVAAAAEGPVQIEERIPPAVEHAVTCLRFRVPTAQVA